VQSLPIRIAKRLRQLREDKGWSQRDLSLQTKGLYSPSRIGNYEQGTRDIGVVDAVALAAALETSAAHLLCLDEDSPVLSPQEAKMLQSFRALPENVRTDYARRIHALALAYQNPVADERIPNAYRAPAAPQTAPAGRSRKPRKT
jgi:transcriptional regulator with XRE-family HTH domain